MDRHQRVGRSATGTLGWRGRRIHIADTNGRAAIMQMQINCIDIAEVHRGRQSTGATPVAGSSAVSVTISSSG